MDESLIGVLQELGTPQPKQIELLNTTTKYTFFGGGRGGGKSWLMDYIATIFSIKCEGIKILFIRRTLPELRENHINTLIEKNSSISSYNEQKRDLTFKNGSRIHFDYADTISDELHYQGTEWDIIILEEAPQLRESLWDTVKATLRGSNPFPKRIFLTGNPGDTQSNVGLLWVRRLFVERDFHEGENPDDYGFVQSTVFDNKYLVDDGYPDQLRSISDPNLRKAWLEGDWYSFSGAFFHEFSPIIHMCEPFPIPKHWVKYRTLDYGLDKLAVLFIAVSETGEEFVYKEIHEPDLIIRDACKKILAVTADDDIICTYAPPDLWARTKDTGRTMAEVFYDNGVPLSKSSNQRIAGWQMVKDHLKRIPSYDGEGETSRMKIFSSLKILPKYIRMADYSKTEPSDMATEPHEITHICDALRYFCVMHTIPNSNPLPRARTEKEMLDAYRRNAIDGNTRKRNRWT